MRKSQSRTPALVLGVLSTVLAACGSSEPPASTTSTGSPGTSSGASATSTGTPAESSDASTEGTANAAETSTGTAAANGGGTATATASAQPAAPAPLPTPDIPMRVQSQPGSTGWFDNIDADRRADGSLFFRDEPIGRIEGNRLLSMSGQLIPLTGRISIGTRAGREHMEVQPDGSILMDGGRLTIDAQGDVLLTRRGSPARPVHVHVTGYRPDAIGLADILVVYGILKADISSR